MLCNVLSDNFLAGDENGYKRKPFFDQNSSGDHQHAQACPTVHEKALTRKCTRFVPRTLSGYEISRTANA